MFPLKALAPLTRSSGLGRSPVRLPGGPRFADEGHPSRIPRLCRALSRPGASSGGRLPRLQPEAKGPGFLRVGLLLEVRGHQDHRWESIVAKKIRGLLPDSPVPSPREVVVRVGARDRNCVRMATNGSAAPAAKPEGKKPEAKKPEGNKRIKDETIAKAAGAVIAGGIIWSLFKSVTGRGKRQHVAITEKDTLSKDVQHTAQHAGKEIEHKAKGVAHGAEHKSFDFKHSIDAAGSKVSHLGHKKLDGKTIQVHKGDTLWGLAKKHNVSVESLMIVNGIKNGDNISAGDSIVLPK